MALQSLDIKQRSATTTPSTQVRQTVEIHWNFKGTSENA